MYWRGARDRADVDVDNRSAETARDVLRLYLLLALASRARVLSVYTKACSRTLVWKLSVLCLAAVCLHASLLREVRDDYRYSTNSTQAWFIILVISESISSIVLV